MEDRTLKITSALADPTRYSIYQYIVSVHRGVTVLEIADHFNIHPNVARLHLTKLEDVNLIVSKAEKSGKGGRPGKVYVLSDEVVNINFPPRDYQTLSDIAIESLLSLGREGEETLQKVAHRIGKEQAMQAIQRDKLKVEVMSLEEKIPYIQKLAFTQGINPQIEQIDKYSIRFRVYNCPFKETADKHHEVCKMHHAMLTGMFEAFFGRVDLIMDDLMIHGCSSCDYTMVHLP
jgi:predicted ArsR family transcriptional regulator